MTPVPGVESASGKYSSSVVRCLRTYFKRWISRRERSLHFVEHETTPRKVFFPRILYCIKRSRDRVDSQLAAARRILRIAALRRR